MTVDTETEEEVCLKQTVDTETEEEPQCCEIFDRFCRGCREIKIRKAQDALMKAQDAYREFQRQSMVVPAPGEDSDEEDHESADLVPRNKTDMLFDVVDLVSDTDDDREGLGDVDVDN